LAHPYSALNLRLALALFGVVSMVGLTVAFIWFDRRGFAIVTAVIAVIAAVNVAVVQRRRVQRRRREHGAKHSLFE
jgi:uncharacterized membrane protein YqjE